MSTTSAKRRSVLKYGVIDLGLESADLPNGNTIELPVIRHPGASAIVAIDAEGRVTMISQWRHAIGGFLWEIPAGCRNSGENPRDCAERELREEAGLVAARWDHLGEIVTIPSFCDERIDIFLARELGPGHGTLDEDEIIRVQRFEIEETTRMIRDGDIIDAKTIVGLCHARAFIGGARK
ncbi:MAG: NUDIX hydrolase [Candidatus Binataceae bacterium]